MLRGHVTGKDTPPPAMDPLPPPLPVHSGDAWTGMRARRAASPRHRVAPSHFSRHMTSAPSPRGWSSSGGKTTRLAYGVATRTAARWRGESRGLAAPAPRHGAPRRKPCHATPHAAARRTQQCKREDSFRKDSPAATRRHHATRHAPVTHASGLSCRSGTTVALPDSPGGLGKRRTASGEEDERFCGIGPWVEAIIRE